MQVRIYQLSKPPTQSGLTNKKWVLEFLPTFQQTQFIDSTLGWTGTVNPQTATRIYFNNKAEAIKFCHKNNFNYELIVKFPRKLVKKNYADNFK